MRGLTLISFGVKGPCPSGWDGLGSQKVTGCYFWLLSVLDPRFPAGLVG